MSANIPSTVPVAVVSAYPQEPTTESSDDQDCSVYATAIEPSSDIPTVVASPAHNQYVEYDRPIPRGPAGLRISSPYVASTEFSDSESILLVLNHSRNLRCIACVDIVILFIYAIFLPVVLILLVGKPPALL